MHALFPSPSRAGRSPHRAPVATNGNIKCRFIRHVSFCADRTPSGPIAVADALQRHFKKTHRRFARLDAITGLMPLAILGDGVIAHRCRSGRYLPAKALGGRLIHKVAREALGVRTQVIGLGGNVVGNYRDASSMASFKACEIAAPAGFAAKRPLPLICARHSPCCTPTPKAGKDLSRA